MRAEHFVLLSTLVSFVHSGPVNPSCGVTRTFTGINECSATFGGTWVECAKGMTVPPTFTAPPCAITTALHPIITPAPPIQRDASAACRPHSVCVDKFVSCGGTEYNSRYGGCYDACGPEPPMKTPTCKTPVDPNAPGPKKNNVGSNVKPAAASNPKCSTMSQLCYANW